MNTLLAADDRCDCEKILENGENGPGEFPAPAVHKHVHPDEYFLPFRLADPGVIPFMRLILPQLDTCHVLSGYISLPEQPPQTA